MKYILMLLLLCSCGDLEKQIEDRKEEDYQRVTERQRVLENGHTVTVLLYDIWATSNISIAVTHIESECEKCKNE